ncbi:hypothetical protein NC651_023706 [Populus alba x Populus x berolinensis]|nr:hypothetical protein NC651_023706 [Populus alba x Populus x berolinensis]
MVEDRRRSYHGWWRVSTCNDGTRLLLLDERAIQWFIHKLSMATVSGKEKELSGGQFVGRLTCGGAILLMTKRGNN